jgi:protein-disulfide isomerase
LAPPNDRPDTPATRRERRALERADRVRSRGRVPSREARPGWRSPFALISLGAVAVAVVVIVFLVARPPNPEGDILTPANSYPADLVDGESVGRADAPVVIEVYSDFQCPICGTFAKQYITRLVPDFVVGGKLRLVSKDIAILGATAANESLAAATAARCAGAQGRYWQYHDLLFWNQAGENLGGFRTERLQRMADAAGLDRAAWDTCMADPTNAQAIQATTAAAAGRGINQTPTLSVNGQLVAGLPQSYEALASVVSQLAAISPAPSSSPQSATQTPSEASPTP